MYVSMLSCRIVTSHLPMRPAVCVHRYLCRACLREFSDWPQLLEHHQAQHPTIERGVSVIDPRIKQVWTGVADPVGLLNVCSSRIAAFGMSKSAIASLMVR